MKEKISRKELLKLNEAAVTDGILLPDVDSDNKLGEDLTPMEQRTYMIIHDNTFEVPLNRSALFLELKGRKHKNEAELDYVSTLVCRIREKLGDRAIVIDDIVRGGYVSRDAINQMNSGDYRK